VLTLRDTAAVSRDVPRLARTQAVFGSCDGLVLVVGLLASLAVTQPHALVRAALGAGIAELVGMSAGSWLSDARSGPWPALANGGAAFAACLIPALPYTAATGQAALWPSLALVAVVAGVIAWLRPERGLLAVAETYGVLLGAGVLCWAASLI
jgi:hypothetical protein